MEIQISNSQVTVSILKNFADTAGAMEEYELSHFFFFSFMPVNYFFFEILLDELFFITEFYKLNTLCLC